MESVIISNKVLTMAWLETILNNFPNAVEGGKLTLDITDFLARKYSFTPKNTIFGFSTCSDEINRTVTRFVSYYGEEQFPLGGLAGYPFRGKTGFWAFSHHAPNEHGDGNLVILYGPHVSVNSKGELGKILRKNQSQESSACGAAIAFLTKYKEAAAKGIIYEPKYDALDLEQFTIEKLMSLHVERILGSQNPIRELVEVNYEIIEQAIEDIISNLKHHFNGRIVLVGGVLLNTTPNFPGYFDFRKFDMYRNGDKMDLRKEI